MGSLVSSQAQPSTQGDPQTRESSTQGGASACAGEKSRLVKGCVALLVFTATREHADGSQVIDTRQVSCLLIRS